MNFSKIDDDIAELILKYWNEESLMTADEIRKMAAYLLTAKPDIAYQIAYKKSTKAQRLEFRRKTDARVAVHADAAVASKARRAAIILGMVNILINAAMSMAVSGTEK